MANQEDLSLHPTPLGGVDPALVGNGLVTDPGHMEKYTEARDAGSSPDEAMQIAGDGVPFTGHNGTVGVARPAQVAPANPPQRERVPGERFTRRGGPPLPRGVLPPRA